MKFFVKLLTLACLSALLLAGRTQLNAQSVPARSAQAPRDYAAQSDRKLDPYPEKPPAIGPAGSIITDPTFGSRIVRITDERSDPGHMDRPLFTPSSAEQNIWNTTSTMFYVNTSGGSFLLYDFDPATLKPRLASAPRLPWNAEPQFSFSQPNILYGLVGREPIFQAYDVKTGKVSDVNDASKCVKLQGSDSGHGISVSSDDNRFSAALGPQQDNNYLIYIYDRSLGCRWYNTQTGEIGGQWGPKGTISAPDRFLVHNARMAKSGKYIYVTRGGGRIEGSNIGKGWVAWEIDTTNVRVCAQGCKGHHVLGYSHILGASGMVHPMEIWMRPLNNLEKTSSLIDQLEPAKNFWFDAHYSWNNVGPDDSEPVCFSTYRPTNPETPGTPLLVTGPWENEIDCAETDGKASKVWRFAHTYSTAKNGFWSTPRGNVSQDGRFYSFTSDWEDQLGKAPNGKYRTDVFVVELK